MPRPSLAASSRDETSKEWQLALLPDLASQQPPRPLFSAVFGDVTLPDATSVPAAFVSVWRRARCPLAYAGSAAAVRSTRLFPI